MDDASWKTARDGVFSHFFLRHSYGRSELEDQKYRTEIIIHVADLLDAMRRSALTDDLEKRNGILSAAFCPIGNHLMLVEYNNRGIESQ